MLVERGGVGVSIDGEDDGGGEGDVMRKERCYQALYGELYITNW